MRSLRAGHAGSMTPLVFEVADFKADKSAGKVRIDADYTLKIWVRGKRKAGAIHAVPMHITLSRGPDRMWYLDQGTIGRDPSLIGLAARPDRTGCPGSLYPIRGLPHATTASGTPGKTHPKNKRPRTG